MYAKYVSKCNHDSRRDTEKRWSTSFVRDMSHICIRYVTRMKEAMCRRRVTSRHESCRTYEWAMSPWGMSQGWHVVNGSTKHVAHICKSHVTYDCGMWHVTGTCHVNEGDVSHIGMWHVAHNVACCTQCSMLQTSVMLHARNSLQLIVQWQLRSLTLYTHYWNKYICIHAQPQHTHTYNYTRTHTHTHSLTHTYTHTRTHTHDVNFTSSLIPILFTSSSDQSLILWSNL